jgi:hypothetical protein
MGQISIWLMHDDVNLMGYKTDTKRRTKESLIDAGKEVPLEVNGEKTKYMLPSC